MLEQYRAQIDELDQQIITLLDARFTVTKQVGLYKQEQQLPILNEAREQLIISAIKEQNLNNSEQVCQVYRALLDISKHQQDE